MHRSKRPPKREDGCTQRNWHVSERKLCDLTSVPNRPSRPARSRPRLRQGSKPQGPQPTTRPGTRSLVGTLVRLRRPPRCVAHRRTRHNARARLDGRWRCARRCDEVRYPSRSSLGAVGGAHMDERFASHPSAFVADNDVPRIGERAASCGRSAAYCGDEARRLKRGSPTPPQEPARPRRTTRPGTRTTWEGTPGATGVGTAPLGCVSATRTGLDYGKLEPFQSSRQVSGLCVTLTSRLIGERSEQKCQVLKSDDKIPLSPIRIGGGRSL
jgi:hypothetical protein